MKGVCKGEGNAGRVGNLAGRVRFEELADAIARRSYIDHALSITIKCTDGTAVYPASTNSGLACSDPHALPTRPDLPPTDDARAPEPDNRISRRVGRRDAHP